MNGEHIIIPMIATIGRDRTSLTLSSTTWDRIRPGLPTANAT
jgi:hypothetical protein